MSEHTQIVNGHPVAYLDHRFECTACGARLLSIVQFQVRECPGPRSAEPASTSTQAVVHIEPIPAPAGIPHGDGLTFELQQVTCEACRAGVIGAVRAQRPAERQRWARRGGDVTGGLVVEVDAEGRASVSEAVLAQLLADAGWERTA